MVTVWHGYELHEMNKAPRSWALFIMSILRSDGASFSHGKDKKQYHADQLAIFAEVA
ncbi:hypothetical protein [Paenibacillus bovis]|uniref:hypothetical protein n=1 Tax=Paenibacillus bovis TaxID=1616788 RepID=UPI0013140882|nr:hypothetical protein [Paenibacillus bovis]